jgi:antitoxin component YwqK of YwqJK toxin-antitoxin module
MGKLHGEWKSYYKKKNLHVEGIYENDLKVGTWKKYSKKRILLEEGSYKIITIEKSMKYGPFKKRKVKESAKDGLWTWYSEKDGGKTHEGSYSKGKEQGKWVYYYPGGAKPMQELSYKNGKLNGTTVKYNWRPYRITTKIDYKDGVKDGKMIIYNKRGRVAIEKNFKEGIEVRSDGKPVRFSP